MESYDVIIVGAGESGVATALSMRSCGFAGTVKLLGADTNWTYHRPPLSKGFLMGTEDRDSIRSASADDFRDMSVEVSFGTRVHSIDRASKRVITAEQEIEYGHLVLATGAHNRSISDHPIDGLLQLRSVEDAEALRDALYEGSRIVVIGAGFLGLEVASAAADLGLEVEVVEFAQTPLGGRVSAATVQAIERYLRSRSIQFSLGVGVADFLQEDGHLSGIRLSDGRILRTEIAVACVGVIPEVSLAREAGLSVGNGIEVDEYLVSVTDPGISAVGDCASYPSGGGARLRVESIANALGQGDCVAQRLAGNAQKYSAVPWFWSIYGPHRLEIVGTGSEIDEVIVHGRPLDYDFAAYCFSNGVLKRFESLNRAREHMKMRRIFQRGHLPGPDDVGSPDFDLSGWPLQPAAVD